MDKAFLVEQLHARVRTRAEEARRQAADAHLESKTGAQRAVNLAKGTSQRFEAAVAAVDAIESFRPHPLKRGERIGLGAIVEIEGEEGGGKTVFLAPAGAGEELTGPGGDGFFHVVTPVSPLGRAMLGKRVGDVIEVPRADDISEWTITYAG